MAELGKMEKPEAEAYRSARKLLLVPVLYAGDESPDELKGLIDRYWEGVKSAIRSLELQIGQASRIYHEFVAEGGEGGYRTLEMVCKQSHELARQQAERGAVLESFEDEETLSEFTDWRRCATVGLMSKKARNIVAGNYAEAFKKRVEGLAKKIDETLGPSEVAILFISEDHKLQFPAGIEVFYVAPPALDDIHRWLRDYQAQQTTPGAG